MSADKAETGHGTSSEDNIHLHYSKKPHSHPIPQHRTGHHPEIYCVTRDGRLLVFKLESNTTIGVGDFSKFTRRLQVWVPFRCDGCELTQFMDMGVSYIDDDVPEERSVDRGKTRIYGGRFACPGCTGSIRIETKLEFYASAGRFTKEAAEGAKIIYLAGVRDFFKSAKNASIPGYADAQEKQGSLMHFG